jgi:hypothetical protein
MSASALPCLEESLILPVIPADAGSALSTDECLVIQCLLTADRKALDSCLRRNDEQELDLVRPSLIRATPLSPQAAAPDFSLFGRPSITACDNFAQRPTCAT